MYRSTQINSRTKTVTTSASALTSELVFGVVLQADPDNTVDIFLGDSAAQNIQLLPGQSVSMMIENAALVYVKTASSTAVLNYLVLK